MSIFGSGGTGSGLTSVTLFPQVGNCMYSMLCLFTEVYTNVNGTGDILLGVVLLGPISFHFLLGT